jgi:hypothetical protein
MHEFLFTGGVPNVTARKGSAITRWHFPSIVCEPLILLDVLQAICELSIVCRNVWPCEFPPSVHLLLNFKLYTCEIAIRIKDINLDVANVAGSFTPPPIPKGKNYKGVNS